MIITSGTRAVTYAYSGHPITGDCQLHSERPAEHGPIQIESRMNLGVSLQTHVANGILRLTGRRFGQLVGATVHFAESGGGIHCTIHMSVGGGSLAKFHSDADGADCYKAFNIALDKVAVQLRRAKRVQREDKPVRTDKDVNLRGRNVQRWEPEERAY